MELVRLRPTTLHSKEPTCFIHVDDEKAPSRSTLPLCKALHGLRQVEAKLGDEEARLALLNEKLASLLDRYYSGSAPSWAHQPLLLTAGRRTWQHCLNTAGPIVQRCQCCSVARRPSGSGNTAGCWSDRAPCFREGGPPARPFSERHLYRPCCDTSAMWVRDLQDRLCVIGLGLRDPRT